MPDNNNKKISFLGEEAKKKEERATSKKVEKEEIKMRFPVKDEQQKDKEKSKFLWRQKLADFWRARKEKREEKKHQRASRAAADQEQNKQADQDKELQKADVYENQAAIAKLRKKIKKMPESKVSALKAIRSESPVQKTAKKKNNQQSKKDILAAPKDKGVRVSLAPEEMLVPLKVRFSKSLLFFIIIQALVLLLMLLAYSWMVWQDSQVNIETRNIAQQLEGIKKEIAETEKSVVPAKELQQQINLLADFLDKHLYWTNFFSLLEKNTVSGVYYNSLAADASGGITLSAVADSYTSLARQLTSFEETPELAEKVMISSVAADTGEDRQIKGINFDISLTLNKQLFLKN